MLHLVAVVVLVGVLVLVRLMGPIVVAIASKHSRDLHPSLVVLELGEHPGFAWGLKVALVLPFLILNYFQNDS